MNKYTFLKLHLDKCDLDNFPTIENDERENKRGQSRYRKGKKREDKVKETENKKLKDV